MRAKPTMRGIMVLNLIPCVIRRGSVNSAPAGFHNSRTRGHCRTMVPFDGDVPLTNNQVISE